MVTRSLRGLRKAAIVAREGSGEALNPSWQWGRFLCEGDVRRRQIVAANNQVLAYKARPCRAPADPLATIIPRRSLRTSMQSCLRAIFVVVPLCLALGSRADEAVDSAPFSVDPILRSLHTAALSMRPELRQSEALARAEREQASQRRALPDPTIAVGVQNDGFRKWQVGTSHTSWYEIGLSQGFPWPGKRALRGGVAELAHSQAEALVARVRLSTEAEVSRAYLALLLARDQLRLLGELEGVWQRAAQTARSHYETGDGAQSDVLRAQLESNRLRQRRILLTARAQMQVQTLNRLRGQALDTPLETLRSVRTFILPPTRSVDDARRDAIAGSPELTAARLAARRAVKQSDLARKERWPDFNVSAGIMPRGSMDTMWRASVAVGLPVWSAQKQGPALAEHEAHATAEAEAVKALEQMIAQRVAERHIALGAMLETITLFRDGLLVQSRATAESTLAQYRVGRSSFAAVLDANAGYLNDEEAYLRAIAEAQQIAIADSEISLAPVGLNDLSGTEGAVPGTAASAPMRSREASTGTDAPRASPPPAMGM